MAPADRPSKSQLPGLRSPDPAAPSVDSDRWTDLAIAMPRPIVAGGLAETLQQRWLEGSAASRADGFADYPRWPLDRALQDALFDARRARRLIRGLERAADHLQAEAAGLARVRAEHESRRISRLLVVSTDGALRFYRQVERVRSTYLARIEVLAIDVDDRALGAAIYGRGKRVRAVLVAHKEPVSRILALLAERPVCGPGSARA